MTVRSLIIAAGIATAFTAALPAQTTAEKPAAPVQTTEEKPATPPPPPSPGMERVHMTAGDFNGDGHSESVIYDSDVKGIRIIDYSIAPVQSMGIFTRDGATEMVAADLDGDGKDELITGEGLGG